MLVFKTSCPDCGRVFVFDSVRHLEITLYSSKKEKASCVFCFPHVKKMLLAFDFALKTCDDPRAIMTDENFFAAMMPLNYVDINLSEMADECLKNQTKRRIYL